MDTTTTRPTQTLNYGDYGITITCGARSVAFPIESATNPIEMILVNTANELDRVTQTMLIKARQIASSANRAISYLEEDYSLNRLGHFQSETLEFDQMCATRALLADQLVALIAAFEKQAAGVSA